MPSGNLDAWPTRLPGSFSNACLDWILPGFVVTAVYVNLAARSITPAGASLIELLTSAIVVVVVIGFVALRSNRRGMTPPTKGILGFSLIFHLIGIAGGPVLEDDGHRYLFDAWVFSERGSPYGIAPSVFFEDENIPSVFEEILSGVNNPDLPTIYGPTAEWVFRAAYAVSPGDIRVLQAIMSGFSFGLVCLIALKARPLPLLFFAWHPLLMKEFALTAHPDVLAVFLVVAALSIPRRLKWGVGTLVGLAVGAKIFALLIAPVLLGRSKIAWCGFGITLAILYGPFVDPIIFVDNGLADSSLFMMGAFWVFNAPLYLAFAWVGSWELRALFASALIGYWILWTHQNWDWDRDLNSVSWPRGDRLFGVMLICSPVVNPWYLIWPLAFWALRPTRWLAVASIAVMLSYVSGLNLIGASLSPYEVLGSALVVEGGLIALALGIDVRTRRA